MGKPINGSDLMLFIDSTGEGTAFKSIAFATSHSLSISAETVEQVLKILVENVCLKHLES